MRNLLPVPASSAGSCSAFEWSGRWLGRLPSWRLQGLSTCRVKPSRGQGAADEDRLESRYDPAMRHHAGHESSLTEPIGYEEVFAALPLLHATPRSWAELAAANLPE